ncbi:hypothetical protein [Qipengyuania sp. JC766]|uniref:hypothetical protein n=1 Tax=Qipengyuania sp. JC766 TaxID=3232139 RepID=UPI003458A4F0
MDLVLSIVMLAVVTLLVAAIFVWRRGKRKQAVLMVILAIVGLGNIALWTIPTPVGTSPLEQLEAETAKQEG